MNLYKTKLGKVINFIKNEGKFQRADLVQVLKNNSNYEKYGKYVEQFAVVTDVNYTKKDYMVGLKFLDGEGFYFKPNELRKCDYIEEHTNRDYLKLLKMI